MGERRPDGTRGMMSFALIILIALVVSIFLKNVKLGLVIGLALGLLGSGFLKRRR